MAGYEVARWRRYGKDRLYVTSPDGARVGWLCLQTGQKAVDLSEHQAGFEAAVAAWSREHGTALRPDDMAAASDSGHHPAMPAVSAPGAAPMGTTDAAVPRPRDLAENRPGAAARNKAVALRRDAPVKAFVARVLGVHTEERAWRVGADGEEAVAATLAKLGPEWRVLHAIPVGDRGADIDHLVIGPPGAFTLNAKHHREAKVWLAGDNMRVNGQPVPYIRNARFEATRAARLLTAATGRPVDVEGVVVLVRPEKIVFRDQPTDVVVCERHQLRGHLENLPPILTSEAIDMLYGAARRSETWTRSDV